MGGLESVVNLVNRLRIREVLIERNCISHIFVVLMLEGLLIANECLRLTVRAARLRLLLLLFRLELVSIIHLYILSFCLVLVLIFRTSRHLLLILLVHGQSHVVIKCFGLLFGCSA